MVKTYGAKFVTEGIANLTASSSPLEIRTHVATMYEDTSAYIHPSAKELTCFVVTRDGRRVATALGVELYADILHSLLSGLCLRLDHDYGLSALTDEDKRMYHEESLERMKQRNSSP